jgi:hypothetical protein
MLGGSAEPVAAHLGPDPRGGARRRPCRGLRGMAVHAGSADGLLHRGLRLPDASGQGRRVRRRKRAHTSRGGQLLRVLRTRGFEPFESVHRCADFQCGSWRSGCNPRPHSSSRLDGQLADGRPDFRDASRQVCAALRLPRLATDSRRVSARARRPGRAVQVRMHRHDEVSWS